MKYCLYHLEPIRKLNRFSNDEARRGVLLCRDGAYFDYHPWAQFGDKSIEIFLEEIKSHGCSSHTNDVFELDRERSSIEHKSFLNHSFSKIGACSKFKYTDRDSLVGLLNESAANSRVRVDFNNGLIFPEVMELWNSLTEDQKLKIDFFEDPCPESKDWAELQKSGIKIACDRNSGDTRFFDYNILKPNVDLFKNLKTHNIFSSYMGHDLGRYHCYLALMKYGKLELFHGVDTPNIYKNQRKLFLEKSGNILVPDELEIRKMYQDLEEMVWTDL